MHHNKKSILLIFIAAVFLVIITACSKGSSSKIVGTWYSDRPDNDILTLSKEGRYTSSVWLAPGAYTVEGDVLRLTDSFGTTKELLIQSHESGQVLFYENEPLSRTYFSSQELAQESLEANKPKELTPEELQTLVAGEIIPGEWISYDESTDLVITDKEITLNYHGAKLKSGELIGAETVLYSYVIKEITQTLDMLNEINYLVKMDLTEIGGEHIYRINTMRITKNKSGSYRFATNSFPYSVAFDKVP